MCGLQICHEFERFSSYMPDLNVMVIYGGVDVTEQKKLLKSKPPHIVVGTPGRIKSVRGAAAFALQSTQRRSRRCCSAASSSWPRMGT